MLEQFRMLEAALRLEHFTVAQLARESGVIEGTAQKMLGRHRELFEKSAGPRTGRRGGQPILYRVRAEARRALATTVQEAADEPKLPPLPRKATGETLGLLLAEDTLQRSLPRAHQSERKALLSAVESHFALADPSETPTVNTLKALHENLLCVVTYREWLDSIATLVPQPWEAEYRRVIEAVECVLSIDDSQARQREPQRLDRAVKLLEGVGADVEAVASLASFVPKFPLVGKQVPAPHDILTAIRGVLLHPRWHEVVGDLPLRQLVSQINLPVRPLPITSSYRPPRALVPTSLRAASLPGTEVLQVLKGQSHSQSRTHLTDLDPGFRVRIMSGQGFDRLPVHLDAADASHLSFATSYRVVIVGMKKATQEIGQIVAFDFGLVSRSLTSAIVATRTQPSNLIMLPYSALRFGPSPRNRFQLGGDQLLGGAWYAGRSAPKGVRLPVTAALIDAKIGTLNWTLLEAAAVVGPKASTLIWTLHLAGQSRSIGCKITLTPESRVDVYSDPGHLHGFYNSAFGGEFAQKVGDLISIDVDPFSGSLTSAYIQERISGYVNQVPFQTLEYRAERNCFVMHSVPGSRPNSSYGSFSQPIGWVPLRKEYQRDS